MIRRGMGDAVYQRQEDIDQARLVLIPEPTQCQYGGQSYVLPTSGVIMLPEALGSSEQGARHEPVEQHQHHEQLEHHQYHQHHEQRVLYKAACQLQQTLQTSAHVSWQIARGQVWQHRAFQSYPQGDRCEPVVNTPAEYASSKYRGSVQFSYCSQVRSGAYRLQVSAEGIVLYASEVHGFCAGVQTLRQMIMQCADVLPCVSIQDEPTYEVRGYYLDVTRGRIPTYEWLCAWAEKLSLYKYNQLQLYVEHVFMIPGGSAMWRGADPLPPELLMRFDEYCADLGIELVPSIATFGHHYMALRTQQWRHLSEFPEMADDDFGFIARQEHHTLNPTLEESQQWACQLIDYYSTLFRSRKFNICADETFDLGRGRSRAVAQESSSFTLYAQFVRRLCDHVHQLGKQPMMWADVALGQPEMLQDLPDDLIVLNWQYAPEVDVSTFQTVSEQGARQYVCPAVHAWNSLTARVRDAWHNIARVAWYGAQYEAEGLLVTDWGDFGHVNDPVMALPGLMIGAQAGWNPGHRWIRSAAQRSEQACNNRQDVPTEFTALMQAASFLEFGIGDVFTTLDATLDGALFTWTDLIRYLELPNEPGQSERERQALRMRESRVYRQRAVHCNQVLAQCRQRFAALRSQYRQSAVDVVVRSDQTGGLGQDGARLTRVSMQEHYMRAVSCALSGQQLLNDWAAAICQLLRLGWDDDIADGYGAGGYSAAACGGVGEPVEPAVFDDGSAVAEVVSLTPRDVLALADALEEWTIGMKALWRSVSEEAEVRRVERVVYEMVDQLRSLVLSEVR